MQVYKQRMIQTRVLNVVRFSDFKTGRSHLPHKTSESRETNGQFSASDNLYKLPRFTFYSTAGMRTRLSTQAIRVSGRKRFKIKSTCICE